MENPTTGAHHQGVTTILELLLGYVLGLLADPALLVAGALVAVVVLSGLAARAIELVEGGGLRIGRRPGLRH